jgi:transcriptional regulator with XRE-family HTH domain
LFGAEPNKAGANAGTERDRPETAMERLRGLRERNCLSREKFARAIGVCPRTVWLWERGSSLPSAAKAALLAERFGVTTEWIFGCDKKKSGRPGTSGSRLKKLRESAGLSATAFGRLTGAGMRAVLHWENDYCVPGPAELAAITEHFGVTPEWILKGTEDSAAELMGVSAVRRKG